MSEKKSYWIEFIGDRSIKIEEGQSILQASLAAGIPHFHACGGNAQCSTCRVLVKQGKEFLSPYNDKEAALRQQIPFPKDVRLACQTYVQGAPVLLHRIIRDETDMGLYLDEDEEKSPQEIGEERELALFFLDIRNFTPFMESYLAFDVIHILRRLFQLFRKAIAANEGTIIETAGDGLYAVFGLKSTIEEAVPAAYQAGTEILEELQVFNDQYLEKYFYHRFEIGIGLHAGKVIVGNIGLGVQSNLTVMGLPVNIASRLQAATKRLNNSFVVSDEAYQLLTVKPSAKTEQIELQGITGLFTVYPVGDPYDPTLNEPLQTWTDDDWHKKSPL